MTSHEVKEPRIAEEEKGTKVEEEDEDEEDEEDVEDEEDEEDVEDEEDEEDVEDEEDEKKLLENAVSSALKEFISLVGELEKDQSNELLKFKVLAAQSALKLAERRYESFTPGPLTLVPSRSTGTFQAFVRSIQEAAKSDGFVSLEKLNFHVSWWASLDGSTKSLYVRECYKEMYDSMISYKNASGGIKLITGTPGTGKSGFGLYAFARLIHNKELVLYSHKTDDLVLWTENIQHADLISKISKIMKIKPGLHTFVHDDTLMRKLLGISSLFFILDPPAGSSVTTSGSAFRLVVSSPYDVKLGDVYKSQKSSIEYMPLWDEAELQKIRPLHKPKLRPEEVTQRFDEFGGSARIVFDESFRAKVGRAVQSASISDVKGLLQSSTKGDMSALLVHAKPSPDRLHFERIWASNDIRTRIYNKLMDAAQNDLDAFISLAKVEGTLQTFRGHVVETRWHRKILEGLEVKVLDMGSELRPHEKPSFKIKLPLMTETLFETIEALTVIKENLYMRPKSKSFKSLDSFALLKRKLFFPIVASEELVLVGIQMTVAPKHGVKNSGLMSVLEKVQTLSNDPKLQMIVVFMSGTGGITSTQSILNEKKKVYRTNHGKGCRFSQFCFVMDVENL